MIISDRRSHILDAAGQPVLRTPDLTPSAAAGSFQGADFSRDRGYVYCPTLNSKDEVDAWSRAELQRRGNVLYNSGGGLPHRLVNGFAQMICGTGLIPHPTPVRVRGREQTTREWVHKVRQLYIERCGSALTYDLAQRRNAFSDQRLAMRLRLKDGDSAKVFARDAATGRLRTVRYEASQIGNGSTNIEQSKGWTDGIFTGPHNEMLKLRVLSKDANGREKKTDIPGDNVLFFMSDERLHQVRGLTAFYPVLNKMFDRGEIQSALTKGIKVASQPVYVIEQDAQQARNLPAGSPGTTLPKSSRVVELSDGRKVNFTDFLNGGEAWGLGAGQSFKIVQSQNPHPNVADYIQEMIRDICMALNVPPEIAWNIIDAGGANMRFIQAEFAQTIEIMQDELIDADLGPHYVAWLYDMITAGEIEEIDGWERHVWIAPARLTVDFGRDGKLYIEELKRGIRTMQSMYGMRGEVAEVGINDYLDERQLIIQGIEDRIITERDGTVRSMTFEEAFPEVRQSPVSDAAATGDQTTDPSGSSADVAARMEAMEARLADIYHAIAFAREPKS